MTTRDGSMDQHSVARVTRELALRLVVPGDASVPLHATLSYGAHDPYAVRAVFRTGRDETVEWVFGRDLLAIGSTGPAGQGDVRVWPAVHEGRDVIFVALASPDGEALLAAPAPALADFVRRTYDLVPAGEESRHLDVDATISALLA